VILNGVTAYTLKLTNQVSSNQHNNMNIMEDNLQQLQIILTIAYAKILNKLLRQKASSFLASKILAPKFGCITQS
jgi:hypothetical protein